MILCYPLPLFVPVSSPTPHGTRRLSSCVRPWTLRPYELGTGRSLHLTDQLLLVPGPFVSLSLRQGHLASRPLLGGQTRRLPVTRAAPITEGTPILATPGAGAAVPLEDGRPIHPMPRLPLALPASLPPDAAIPGDDKIPAAHITTATPPTTQDPEVVPAPPPTIEADSQADLSRSGTRLARFAHAWVAAPPSVRTIVTQGGPGSDVPPVYILRASPSLAQTFC